MEALLESYRQELQTGLEAMASEVREVLERDWLEANAAWFETQGLPRAVAEWTDAAPGGRGQCAVRAVGELVEITVTETISESATAELIASAMSRKSWPASSSTKSTGRKTASVVNLPMHPLLGFGSGLSFSPMPQRYQRFIRIGKPEITSSPRTSSPSSASSHSTCSPTSASSSLSPSWLPPYRTQIGSPSGKSHLP